MRVWVCVSVLGDRKVESDLWRRGIGLRGGKKERRREGNSVHVMEIQDGTV